MRLVKSTWIADANISAELIKKNYFCHGKRSGFKYQCGDEIYDLETINESINLLMESLKRIQRWNVWETWWIDKHKQELLRIRENVKMFRKKYGKSIDKLIKLIDEIINYIDKFQRYWIEKDISYEIKNLVDSLINGKSKVIVRKTSNSLIVSVRSNHITLTIIKLKRRGLIVELTLNGFNGKTMVIPDIFKRLMSKKEYEGFVKELLKALRGGFAETDEGVDKGKPRMSTTHIWQVILWSLLYPGEIHVYIRGININEDDVSISWFLRANDYTSIKGKILNDTDKLHNKAVLAFIFTAILGDGAVFISSSNKYNEAKIQITMSVHELERWKLILDKLGFKWSLQPQLDGIIHVRFHGSKAIDLARAIINIIPPILRDILDVLNIEKWSNLKQIANMELKFRKGESQIDVAGEKFSVVIDNNKIKLMRTIKDWTKVEKILEKIKIIYGEDFVKQVKVHKSNKYIIIKIPMKLIKEHDDIKVQVIQALRRKYERINDNKRKRVIIKHLRKLIEGQS